MRRNIVLLAVLIAIAPWASAWGFGFNLGAFFKKKLAALSDSWMPTATREYEVPTAVGGGWNGSQYVVFGTKPSVNGAALTYAHTYDPSTQTWLQDEGPAVEREWSYFSWAWTGTKGILWGGKSSGIDGDRLFDDGFVYDSTNRTWSTISRTSAPSGRIGHTGIWTGSKFIVWGGNTYYGNPPLNTGGRYDLASNSWTSVSTSNAPPAREGHTAVWTGSKMIIWGGLTASSLTSTGHLYDPTNDTWTAVSNTGAPSARVGHSAIWTGSKMIVWGGNNGTLFGSGSDLNTGAIYDPTDNTWTAISTTGAPSARSGHSTTWTGSKMIVSGGFSYDEMSFLASGGIYDPGTNTWSPLPDSPHHFVTSLNSSISLFFGGGIPAQPTIQGDNKIFLPVARIFYDLTTNTWSSLDVSSPGSADMSPSVWVNSRLLTWGGGHPLISPSNSIYSYNPISNAWSYTQPTGAPSPRFGHSAISTGSKMIVWGGMSSFASFLNTGGVYDPTTDNWAPTSTTSAPSGRSEHIALWTGSKMMIWGGGRLRVRIV